MDKQQAREEYLQFCNAETVYTVHVLRDGLVLVDNGGYKPLTRVGVLRNYEVEEDTVLAVTNAGSKLQEDANYKALKEMIANRLLWEIEETV